MDDMVPGSQTTGGRIESSGWRDNEHVELFTGWHDIDTAVTEVNRILPADTAADVAQAIRFAAEKHGKQTRPTGPPYTEHLLEALEILVRGARVTDRDILVAAVLHDVLEDTGCRPEEITAGFGPHVTELVTWATIPPARPGQEYKTVKERHLAHLADAPEDAKLVKLADRASNVQTLRNMPPDYQPGYYAQTVRYIIPLAREHPWFARWFAEWQEAHRDLGRPGTPAATRPGSPDR
jgi:guanosine-3',5'-bis(diphosphate) 3'-pyrophosphohydrolase